MHNKVEKAAVELVGYAKTSELAPGASETVTVTFDQEQLKSYDYTNAKTYILDAGDYYITAAKNAHDAVNNILSAKGKTVADGMTADGDAGFVATYTPANGTVDTTTYKNDTTTGVEVTNQLDQANGGSVFFVYCRHDLNCGIQPADLFAFGKHFFHNLRCQRCPGSVFNQSYRAVLEVVLCQSGNKVVHKRIDACIICGGCENQLGVTESIAQCLGHIISCKVIDQNTRTSFGTEFIGKLCDCCS